jgi:two-component sensor histidine kinase
VLRLGLIIVLIALVGSLLSGVAAYRVHDQELTVERIALSRAIDLHASLVQERMSERELLARVAAGMFRTPAKIAANMLQPLRAAIYAFKTDFLTATWIARITPDELPAAQAAITGGGFSDATPRNVDGSPRDLSRVTEPIDILLDVEPRTADSIGLPGRTFDQHSVIGPTLKRAMEEGKPIVSDPTPLQRKDNAPGIVIAAPVRDPGGGTAGFVTFSYEIGPLMLTNDDLSLFSVVLKDPRNDLAEFFANETNEIQSRTAPATGDNPPIIRQVMFGGHDWSLAYYAKTNIEARALRMASVTAALGLALTAIICGLFGYVAYSNLRLRREIDVRIGYERRLNAVIDELNHRVKNILAVIQSIVTRTLRHGADVESGRELLIGRIHAMSNVVSLLSERQWQGVPIRGLLEARSIPNADRIAIDGPDIVVSARAAQSLSLLFYELASHTDEGLSLVGKHPTVVARWQIEGTDASPTFHFRWEEFNTSEKTRRPESDFGTVLLDRVAPEALGGVASRYFTEVSFVYELTAPMETVVDLTERDRTDRIVAPIKSKQR